jgi:fructose-1,6-bisphosphatase II / sedoheptulose-1,7-bisphosphatase
MSRPDQPPAADLPCGLEFHLARATEAAAIAASNFVGLGDEQAAETAASLAMKTALERMPMSGRIVVGDGGVDALLQPGLDIGRAAIRGEGGPEIDLSIAPLEGATPTAKAASHAMSIIAVGTRGAFLPVPDLYMEKIAIGPGYPDGVIDIDASAGENARRLADARGVAVSAITACVLDRPRHDRIIADLRRVGARVKLIRDGDVAAVIAAAMPEQDIDLYVGTGGAPEGVLAAAALNCVGGQIQARLVLKTDAERRMADAAGLGPVGRRFRLQDLVSGETMLVATGVTDGRILQGVRRRNGRIETETLILNSTDRVVRRISAQRPEDVLGEP